MSNSESVPKEIKEKEIFVVEGSDVPESIRALRDLVSAVLYSDGIFDSKTIRYLADDEDVRLKYEEFLESRKDVEKEALASSGKLYVVNKERTFNFRDLFMRKIKEMHDNDNNEADINVT